MHQSLYAFPMSDARVKPLAAFLACLVLAACAGTGRQPSASEGAGEGSPYAQKVVDHAVEVVKRLAGQDKDGMLPEFLSQAKGVLVFPGILKAGFFWGLQGGMGVLLARNATGDWSGPAFYSLGGGSFGLQIGLKETAMLLVFMDEDTFKETIRSGLTFDTNVSLAVLNVGGSRQSSSLGEQRDIYCFTDAMGLFVGVSMTGGFVESADSLNRAYYGKQAVTPKAILLERSVDHPGASDLKQALIEAAKPKATSKKQPAGASPEPSKEQPADRPPDAPQ